MKLTMPNSMPNASSTPKGVRVLLPRSKSNVAEANTGEATDAPANRYNLAF